MCYRKRHIEPWLCVPDENFDLYVRKINDGDPHAAHVQKPQPVAKGCAAGGGVHCINTRFRAGKPSNQMEEVGVIMHQWDGQGSFIPGRVSSMIVYAGLRSRPDRRAIPLPFGNRGGFLLSPAYTQLDCLYGIDAATYLYQEAPHPGCSDQFCDPRNPGQGGQLCGFSGYPPTAWRPEDMGQLLDLHGAHGAQYKSPGFHSGYNEVVANSRHLNDQLPFAIEAFFYIKGESPVTSDLGYGIVIDVVQVHKLFLAAYGLSREQVPLLVLDPSNWEEPFTAH